MTHTFIDRPSPNSGARKLVNGVVGVRHLVVHYTGMESCNQALDRLCDETASVSAHYLVDEDGSIYQMVPEDLRAWHAGMSFWGGVRDLNSTSIGIEMVNPGHDHGYRPFPHPQMEAFTRLARDIMERHDIPPTCVLGHSDIAPGRKFDPGELFPWKRLAAEGIGAWPANAKSREDEPDATASLGQLSAIGYAVPLSPDQGADILSPTTGSADVIGAFQRRYRPDRVDGVLDPETAGLIEVVSAFP